MVLVRELEERCCFKRGVGEIQCTLIVYSHDLLKTCKDETTIAGVMEPLNAKYHDVQEHTRVKHLYLGCPWTCLCLVCGLSLCLFGIADVLKDVNPAPGTLFMVNGSSLLLDEAHKKRFHSKLAHLPYLGKGIKINIPSAVTTTKVT